jgi:hypothetical protein
LTPEAPTIPVAPLAPSGLSPAPEAPIQFPFSSITPKEPEAPLAPPTATPFFILNFTLFVATLIS